VPIDLAKGPPSIPLDLIEYLEVLYPNRFPKIAGSDPHAVSADLHRHAGRLEVVAYLRDQFVRQSRKSPSNTASAEV
jgi:hypothetical protein